MSVPRIATSSGEGSLWALSLVASLVLNGLLFFTFSVLASKRVEVSLHREPEPVAQQQATILLIPEPAATGGARVEPPSAPLPSRPDQFARTSPDQASARPEKPAFIGERDTEATSDSTPDPTAAAMPAQKGIDPVRSEVETTESRFQDGEIGDNGKSKPSEPATPPPPPPAEPAVSEPQTPSAEPMPEVAEVPASKSAPREELAQGPNPVDIPVKDGPKEDSPKPTPANRTSEAQLPKPPVPQKDAVQDKPKETTPPDKAPGFAGYQRKTQIRGSISRSGKSALAVENSAMGRYQAALSKAVELEWHRNCVRYRDLITPGYLTVSFVVEQNGMVRSVHFVDAVQSGEVQKGFTLNAIRQAAIPAMPADLKKELGDEPLELIYNFLF
jgi:hypothetical protein